MRKTLLIVAAFLICCLAYSQEGDNGSYGELSVIPRLYLNPGYSFSEHSFDSEDAADFFSQSSLYTLFEGNISDNISFSVCNHWLSVQPGIADLYRNTLRSDVPNWLDWGYFSFSFGHFYFEAGKSAMKIATSEMEANDYESYWSMNSILWNCTQSYQWGGFAGWQTLDGKTVAGAQFSTSPGAARPFTGSYAFAIYGSHEFDNGYVKASFNNYDTGYWGDYEMASKKVFMGAVSGYYDFDVLNLTLDGYVSNIYNGVSLMAGKEMLEDQLTLYAKAGIERLRTADINGFYGGVVAEWYPFRESRYFSDLKFHALASYNGSRQAGEVFDSAFRCSIGALYNFTFSLF